MPLTTAEVEHIAELARLSLTEQEKTLFQDQLSAILDYAAVLQGVDTSAVPPTATVLPLRNIMRDDAVAPSLPTEDVLANAPAAADGYFKVKAILEAEARARNSKLEAGLPVLRAWKHMWPACFKA